MKRLYDLSGGVPKIAQTTLTDPPDENTNIELVAAVSGKAIIPVWFFMYPTGDTTSATITFLLWKGSKYYIRQMDFNPALGGGLFYNFGLTSLSADMGTGAVNIKVITINSYTYKVTLGYYLVDV